MYCVHATKHRHERKAMPVKLLREGEKLSPEEEAAGWRTLYEEEWNEECTPEEHRSSLRYFARKENLPMELVDNLVLPKEDGWWVAYQRPDTAAEIAAKDVDVGLPQGYAIRDTGKRAEFDGSTLFEVYKVTENRRLLWVGVTVGGEEGAKALACRHSIERWSTLAVVR